jgi:hypothetical protein
MAEYYWNLSTPAAVGQICGEILSVQDYSSYENKWIKAVILFGLLDCRGHTVNQTSKDQSWYDCTD